MSGLTVQRIWPLASMKSASRAGTDRLYPVARCSIVSEDTTKDFSQEEAVWYRIILYVAAVRHEYSVLVDRARAKCGPFVTLDGAILSNRQEKYLSR